MYILYWLAHTAYEGTRGWAFYWNSVYILNGLFHLWLRDSNVRFSWKQAEMQTLLIVFWVTGHELWPTQLSKIESFRLDIWMKRWIVKEKQVYKVHVLWSLCGYIYPSSVVVSFRASWELKRHAHSTMVSALDPYTLRFPQSSWIISQSYVVYMVKDKLPINLLVLKSPRRVLLYILWTCLCHKLFECAAASNSKVILFRKHTDTFFL